MPSRSPRKNIILDGATNDSVGVSPLVNDFKNIVMDFSTSGNADLVFRIQGSLSKGAPDFSSAASVTNKWDYLSFWDYSDTRSIIVGSTGIVLTGTDNIKNLQVNIDGIRWINCEISSYVAGTVFAIMTAYNNQ